MGLIGLLGICSDFGVIGLGKGEAWGLPILCVDVCLILIAFLKDDLSSVGSEAVCFVSFPIPINLFGYRNP